jgi:predicted DCC family thiol-disulfide oxidoreductase YuxK
MKIIYIDGHCNLCNGLIKYVYQRKPDLFSYGKTRLDNNLEYVVYRRDGEIFKAEKAVLMIGRDMGGLSKKISQILSLIPNIILRNIYFFISRNRYKIFGKKIICEIRDDIPKDQQVADL